MKVILGCLWVSQVENTKIYFDCVLFSYIYMNIININYFMFVDKMKVL